MKTENNNPFYSNGNIIGSVSLYIPSDEKNKSELIEDFTEILKKINRCSSFFSIGCYRECILPASDIRLSGYPDIRIAAPSCRKNIRAASICSE